MPTPTAPADLRNVRRVRAQVAAMLDRVAELRAQHRPLPKPRSQGELLGPLSPRERVVVRTVAAAEVVRHTHGPDDPRTERWNQVIARNQAEFERTLAEREHRSAMRDAAAHEAEALAGAAVAVAVGAAFWNEAQPEPADLQHDLDQLDSVPAPAVDTSADEAPNGGQSEALWEHLPPELYEDLDAAMQSHPRSIADLIGHAPTETADATPEMGADLGIDAGNGAEL